MGTYEITANVIFRNTLDRRENPCIGIAINDDTNLVNGQYIGPNWDLTPYNQIPFAVSYVRFSEGKVCSLTAKRIHHFTNTADYVSINTYSNTAQGDNFHNLLSTCTILSATIQFKYIGNFENIT